MDTNKNIETLERKILDNLNKIEKNSERIHQNTGALEILKTFKADTNKFFIMWIVTFMVLLGMIGYVIYLSNDTRIVTTQEVEQDAGKGTNYFVGGDVNG